MSFTSLSRERAKQYNRRMPSDIRQYLKDRGIPDWLIERELLGWNGDRITIPVFGRDGEVLTFRFAKSPTDKTGSPKMLSETGSCPELYGSPNLAAKPQWLVICEGEFDRLVLEAHRFSAVTSTAGARVFLPEWAPLFEGIKRIFICFDLDEAGVEGARNVKAVLPRATIVTLPAVLGAKGDVTDYFVRLGKDRMDFELLLATAAAHEEDAEGERDLANPANPPKNSPPAVHKVVASRAARLKAAIPIQRIVERYTDLRPAGARLVGRCPFHDDASPSFMVYPDTGTYYCFGCAAHGDLIAFVINKESKTYGQALEALERFLHTDELFPKSA
jgi:hypothetical protein